MDLFLTEFIQVDGQKVSCRQKIIDRTFGAAVHKARWTHFNDFERLDELSNFFAAEFIVQNNRLENLLKKLTEQAHHSPAAGKIRI